MPMTFILAGIALWFNVLVLTVLEAEIEFAIEHAVVVFARQRAVVHIGVFHVELQVLGNNVVGAHLVECLC